MAKAIVGIQTLTAFLEDMRDFARHTEAGVSLPDTDYQLTFGDARELFAELTPARMALLRALRAGGAMSVYTLASRPGLQLCPRRHHQVDRA
jgi:predicted transcriptional regulator